MRRRGSHMPPLDSWVTVRIKYRRSIGELPWSKHQSISAVNDRLGMVAKDRGRNHVTGQPRHLPIVSDTTGTAVLKDCLRNNRRHLLGRDAGSVDDLGRVVQPGVGRVGVSLQVVETKRRGTHVGVALDTLTKRFLVSM